MDILNSPLYKVLDRITNLFFLNVLWLLSSLPLITIFPATAAMFGVFKDWTKGKEGKLFGSYLRHFKNNFKHSFVYGILWFLIIAIFYIDLRIISDFETYNFILMSLLFLLLILVAFNTVYFVPISIHFKLTLFGKIKNAFLFSIMFFPTTILCILIGVVAFLITIFNSYFMFILFITTSYSIIIICY